MRVMQSNTISAWSLVCSFYYDIPRLPGRREEVRFTWFYRGPSALKYPWYVLCEGTV